MVKYLHVFVRCQRFYNGYNVYFYCCPYLLSNRLYVVPFSAFAFTFARLNSAVFPVPNSRSPGRIHPLAGRDP